MSHDNEDFPDHKTISWCEVELGDSKAEGAREVLPHQKRPEIYKPLFLRPKWSITLNHACLRKAKGKGVGTEIIPRMLNGVQFLHHGIQNQRYIQRQLCACSGSNEVYKRKTKNLAYIVKYLGKIRDHSMERTWSGRLG